MRPRTAALLLLALTLSPAPAAARISLAIDVDGSVGQATAVVVARIATVRPAGTATYQGQRVIGLDVALSVHATLKGSVPPTVTIRHLRVAPTSGPMINGFHFVELPVGQTFVLYLRRGVAGRLELVAPEDSNLITVSAAELPALTRRAGGTAPAERLVDHLSAQLAGCTTGCQTAIWLLSRSATHRQRIRVAAARQAFTAHLVRIARKATDENTSLAAFTVLGELDHRAILPELIGRLCAPQPAGQQYVQANRVSWLQSFPRPVQIQALEQVVRSAPDALTRSTAARRLAYLRGRP